MNRSERIGELMRFDRPIGTFLLLWPTLTALWLAYGEFPNLQMCAIFIVGTFVARAMGCVVNDILDRKFDQHVARTKKTSTSRRSPNRITSIDLFGSVNCFRRFAHTLSQSVDTVSSPTCDPACLDLPADETSHASTSSRAWFRVLVGES